MLETHAGPRFSERSELNQLMSSQPSSYLVREPKDNCVGEVFELDSYRAIISPSHLSRAPLAIRMAPLPHFVCHSLSAFVRTDGQGDGFCSHEWRLRLRTDAPTKCGERMRIFHPVFSDAKKRAYVKSTKYWIVGPIRSFLW